MFYKINEKIIRPKATDIETREKLNQRIIALINNWILLKDKNWKPNKDFTKEFIFTSYTWKWWLHNLEFKEFESYYDYSEAKKEFEMGQFFTPFSVAKEIVETVKPDSSDKILELNVWTWIFLNFLQNFNLPNTYWFDIDIEAIKVASFLYDKANIETKDMREVSKDKYWQFNVVFWNPPFNIRLQYNWKNMSSQDVYLHKLNELLIEDWIAFFIVPYNWLNDDMNYKRTRKFIETYFDLVWQFWLSSNEFKDVWVENFATKVIVLHKKSSLWFNLPNRVNFEKENIKNFWKDFKKDKNIKYLLEYKKSKQKSIKTKLNQTNRQIERKEESLRIWLKYNYFKMFKKFLSLTKEQQDNIENMWKEMKTQDKPDYMEWKEWRQKMITKEKILWKIKTFLYHKTHKDKKEIQLIHKKWKWIVKGYDYNTRKIAKNYKPILDYEAISEPDKIKNIIWEIKTQISLLDNSIEYKFIYPNYKEILRKKTRIAKVLTETEVEDKQYFENLKKIEALDLWIFNFGKVKSKSWVVIDYSYQKEELARNLHKPYYIINFEQWLGKTIVWIAFMKAKWWKTLIIWPSIAIKNTWMSILPQSNTKFKLLSPQDIYNRGKKHFIEDNIDFYLMTFDTVNKTYNYIKKNDFKNILIDESDNIKNMSAKQTQAVLNLRNKCKNKVIMSWTLTRNNIAELYPQLNFLFNNSYNFTTTSDIVYEYDKEWNLVPKSNNKQYEPIPYRWWFWLFKSLFSPSKTSVFGIEKNEQTLYNSDWLQDLIKWMSSRLEQQDILGFKPYTLTQVEVEMTKNEIELYYIIINEFYKIMADINFRSDISSRKKRMLEIVQQIMNLLKATSAPHTYKLYKWWIHWKALKIKELVSKNINKKIMIWTNRVASNLWYKKYLEDEFPNHKIFFIKWWSVSMKNRKKIVEEFKKHNWWAILLSTTWSLSSSVNISETDIVILESLRWNWSQVSQYIFRAIRINNPTQTDVYYLTTKSLELNLVKLIIAKEKLTSVVNKWQVKEEDEIERNLWVNKESLNKNLMQLIKEENEKWVKTRQIKWNVNTNL